MCIKTKCLVFPFFSSERTNHIEKARMPNHHILLVYGNHFILFRFIILRFYVFFLLIISIDNFRKIYKKKIEHAHIFILLSTKENWYVCVCKNKLLVLVFFVYKYFILINHYQIENKKRQVMFFASFLFFSSFSFYPPSKENDNIVCSNPHN